MNALRAATALTVLLSACASSPPEENIVLGVSPAAGALSYLADDGRYVGFHVDICERIVHDFAAATGRPVRITYRPVTSASGVDDVASGAVQFECGATPNTMERMERVDFLPTTQVLETRLAVVSDSPVSDTGHLAGKRIATLAGSPAEQALRRVLREENVSALLVPVRDLDEMIRQLGHREVDAATAETGLLLSVLIRRPATPAFKVRFVGPVVFREPVGIMMSSRPGPLRDLAWQSVVALMQSGDIARVHGRWFESDIPAPLGRLDLPPGDTTRRAWARPNSQPGNARSQF